MNLYILILLALRAQFIGFAPLLLLFGLILVLFIVALLRAAKQRAGRRQAALELGFTPVLDSSRPSLRRISAFYDRVGATYSIQNVFWQAGKEFDLYSYDLRLSTGRRPAVYYSLALVSPGLRLPSFAIVTPSGNDGMMARMAQGVAAGVFAFSGQFPINISSDPEFARHYMVVGADENAIKMSLNGHILDWFVKLREESGMRLLQIIVEDGLIIWSWRENRSFDSPDQVQNLRVSKERLMTLYQMLREKG